MHCISFSCILDIMKKVILALISYIVFGSFFVYRHTAVISTSCLIDASNGPIMNEEELYGIIPCEISQSLLFIIRINFGTLSW